MTVSVIELDTAWQMLRDRPNAALLDVRTEAEWSFVGVPDLSSLGKEVHFIEWTTWPGGEANPDFVATAAAAFDPDADLLIICRSGARSQAAAEALAAAGFGATHNVVAGFEGGLDGAGHRTGGWKHAGLPWVQR
ncbi:MAG: rhodanese-like domain-containing protein [Acidimicrobiales bacterium]